MGVLSSLLPGLRELRTPLTVGSLWFVLVTLVLYPSLPALVDSNQGVSQLATLVGAIPDTLVVPAALFMTYLLGLVVLPLADALMLRITHGVAEYRKKLPIRGRGRTRALLRKLAYGDESKGGVLPLLADAVAKAFAEAKVPSQLHLAFPVSTLARRLEVSAVQLWKSNPSQYQAYDRLGAESDFRRGVIPPVLGFGLWFSISISAWFIPVFLIVIVVLWREAQKSRTAAQRLVATAISAGQMDVPVVTGLVKELGALDLSHDNAIWLGAIVAGLVRRGEWAMAEEMLYGCIDDLGLVEEDDDELITYLEVYVPEMVEELRFSRLMQRTEEDAALDLK